MALGLAFPGSVQANTPVQAASYIAAPDGQSDFGTLDRIFAQAADHPECEHSKAGLWQLYWNDQVEVEEVDTDYYEVRVYEGGGIVIIGILDEI